MGISYQTRNRLRRKVMTAPLTAPRLEPTDASPPVPAPEAARWRALWPLVAAATVAGTAFVGLYR